jgi:hypothetical protein
MLTGKRSTPCAPPIRPESAKTMCVCSFITAVDADRPSFRPARPDLAYGPHPVGVPFVWRVAQSVAPHKGGTAGDHRAQVAGERATQTSQCRSGSHHEHKLRIAPPKLRRVGRFSKNEGVLPALHGAVRG